MTCLLSDCQHPPVCRYQSMRGASDQSTRTGVRARKHPRHGFSACDELLNSSSDELTPGAMLKVWCRELQLFIYCFGTLRLLARLSRKLLSGQCLDKPWSKHESKAKRGHAAITWSTVSAWWLVARVSPQDGHGSAISFAAIRWNPSRPGCAVAIKWPRHRSYPRRRRCVQNGARCKPTGNSRMTGPNVLRQRWASMYPPSRPPSFPATCCNSIPHATHDGSARRFSSRTWATGRSCRRRTGSHPGVCTCAIA